MTPRPPRSTLFPYTTLFRSSYDTAAVGRLLRNTKVNSMITRLGGDPGNLATQHNLLQGIAEQTRLGIPLTISTEDRKSTRLNSSHSQISYAVFCLKKKKTTN